MLKRGLQLHDSILTTRAFLAVNLLEYLCLRLRGFYITRYRSYNLHRIYSSARGLQVDHFYHSSECSVEDMFDQSVSIVAETLADSILVMTCILRTVL